MADFSSSKIAFIGGGNMGSAIIKGLLKSGTPATHITVSEPIEAARARFDALGVKTSSDNAAATAEATLVVLAVKPQVAPQVCRDLASGWSGREELPMVVSIVAGITSQIYAELLRTKEGKGPRLVRVMPNTPALVGEGAAGVFAGPGVTAEDKKMIGELLSGISNATEWFDDEYMIDVVTGVSGSGPAYFFQLVEHLIDAAVAEGMPREQATRLASQTCLGAGKMLVESEDGPAQLRKNVTSPNGTTHAAIVSFENSGLGDVVSKGFKAAVERSVELGKTA